MAASVTALTASLPQPAFADHLRSSGRSSQLQTRSVNYRSGSSRGGGGSSRSNRPAQSNSSRANRSPNGPNSGTNPNHFNNKTSPQNPSRNSNSKYWKKYAGWGGGWNHSWRHGIGWGWGCWFDPWCSWPWYDAIPVADYSNAYSDCAGVIIDGIDYSVPISQMPADSTSGDDSDLYAASRASFLQGDLDSALSAISQAILLTPHNHDMHQFHSLVLFARQEYCKSATVAYAVLQDGPGWTWEALQAFYPSADIYTNQLRSLEQYVTTNASQANVRFLLGYHYLMLNHTDVARRQLTLGVELRPADKLSPRILGGMGDAATTNQAAGDKSNQAASDQATVAPATNVAPAAGNTSGDAPITGTWRASPDKKVQIELALRDDGRFNWKFKVNGRSKDFSGKYQVGARTLTLTRDADRDAMEGTYERLADNSFRFRMKDAEEGDPGLTFTR